MKGLQARARCGVPRWHRRCVCATERTITQKGKVFSESEIAIKVGDTLVFVNDDNVVPQRAFDACREQVQPRLAQARHSTPVTFKAAGDSSSLRHASVHENAGQGRRLNSDHCHPSNARRTHVDPLRGCLWHLVSSSCSRGLCRRLRLPSSPRQLDGRPAV